MARDGSVLPHSHVAILAGCLMRVLQVRDADANLDALACAVTLPREKRQPKVELEPEWTLLEKHANAC